MPDAYQVHDGRFVQLTSSTSSANALLVGTSAVPEGQVRTIVAAYGTCSVAEVQDFWFAIMDRSASYFLPITNPEEFSMAPATYHNLPLLREGMEIKLYPGEKLYFLRDAATAGSTITIVQRYIQTDLPFYDYMEPQEQLRLSKFRRSLVPGAVSPAGGGRATAPVIATRPGGAGGSPRSRR